MQPEIIRISTIVAKIKPPKEALRERGLLDAQSEMLTLNEELRNLGIDVSDPAVGF
ncbi:MAG: hypothetical protein ACK421_11560 [Pseudanabaenaceae cyanobacterium]